MPSPPGSHRSPGDDPRGDGGPEEAAHYIKSALSDLSRMARCHGHDMLGYLLDMAHMEAEEIVRLRGKRHSSRH
ncbi:hypothetical protein V1281_001234 [Nitrobacteraceae bacterium AZCC 2161]